MELDAFSLQIVRFDAFARRAAAEAAENFLALLGKGKVDKQLADVGMRRIAPERDRGNPANDRR
jgi:hypothetical protein